MHDIAITGVSVEVPGARGPAAYLELARSGATTTAPFPAHRRKAAVEYADFLAHVAVRTPSDTSVRFHDGAFLDAPDAFDAGFFGMSPRQAAVTDPHHRLAMRAMYWALEDAGLTGPALAGSDTGVFVGYANNPGNIYADLLVHGEPELMQLAITGSVPSMVAARFSHLFDLHGPSLVVDTACSSSLVAVHQACTAIARGDCGTAVVAGARVVLLPVDNATHRIGIESSDGRTRTFDADADGTGLGEGAAAVVLRPLERALADGDHVYAVVRGSAVNHDGRRGGITTPDAGSQCELIRAAWADARTDPRHVGYVELHGTATVLGDPLEAQGLATAFGTESPPAGGCAVGTAKATTGHLFEASGVLGLARTALLLDARTIPPMAGYRRPNPAIDLDGGPLRVPVEDAPWPAPPGGGPRTAGVSAFGIGGVNCHVVLQEAPDPAPTTATPGRRVLLLSARSERSLLRLVRSWHAALTAAPAGVGLADVCRTALRSRTGHPLRLAVPADDLPDLLGRLDAMLSGIPGPVLCTCPGLAAVATGGPDDLPAAARDAVQDWLDGADARTGAAGPAGGRTVPMPGYSFDEERHSFEFPAEWRERDHRAPVRPGDTFTVGLDPVATPDTLPADARVLVLTAGDGWSRRLLRDAFQGVDTTWLTLAPGDGPAPEDGFSLTEDDMERVAEDAVEGGYTHVVHALATADGPPADAEAARDRLDVHLRSLFQLVKGLMMAAAELDLVVLTRRAIADRLAPEDVVTDHATLVGLTRCAAREAPGMPARAVDVDDEADPATLAAACLAGPTGTLTVRGTALHREVFRPLPPAPRPADVPLRTGGTYVITGGTGSLGLEVALHLARRCPGIVLVLLSRTGMDPTSGPARNPDERDARRASLLAAVRATGSTVEVRRADTADPARLRGTLLAVLRDHGGIDGVVHAAGVPGTSILALRTQQDFDAVVHTKVLGAMVVDEIARRAGTRFVAHFSSVAAVFPASGQGDYTAANYFLDNLAARDRAEGRRTVAVDWVAWKQVGMAYDFATNLDTSFLALPTDQALDILDRALAGDAARVFAGEPNLDSEYVRALQDADIALEPDLAAVVEAAVSRSATRLHDLAASIRAEIEAVEVSLTGGAGDDRSATELMLARGWAEAFGYPTIDVDATFQELGGDSIMAVATASRLGAALGTRLDAVDLLGGRTLAELAAHLDATRSGTGDGR